MKEDNCKRHFNAFNPSKLFTLAALQLKINVANFLAVRSYRVAKDLATLILGGTCQANSTT